MLVTADQKLLTKDDLQALCALGANTFHALYDMQHMPFRSLLDQRTNNVGAASTDIASSLRSDDVEIRDSDSDSSNSSDAEQSGDEVPMYAPSSLGGKKRSTLRGVRGVADTLSKTFDHYAILHEVALTGKKIAEEQVRERFFQGVAAQAAERLMYGTEPSEEPDLRRVAREIIVRPLSDLSLRKIEDSEVLQQVVHNVLKDVEDVIEKRNKNRNLRIEYAHNKFLNYTGRERFRKMMRETSAAFRAPVYLEMLLNVFARMVAIYPTEEDPGKVHQDLLDKVKPLIDRAYPLAVRLDFLSDKAKELKMLDAAETLDRASRIICEIGGLNVAQHMDIRDRVAFSNAAAVVAEAFPNDEKLRRSAASVRHTFVASEALEQGLMNLNQAGPGEISSYHPLHPSASQRDKARRTEELNNVRNHVAVNLAAVRDRIEEDGAKMREAGLQLR